MAAKPWLSHKPWGFPFPYICQAPSHLLFILFLLLLSAYSFTLYTGIYLGIDQGRATTFFCTGWAQVWRPKVPLNIQSIVYRLLMAMQRALIIFSNRKNPSLHSSSWSFLTVTPWIHLGTMSFPSSATFPVSLTCHLWLARKGFLFGRGVFQTCAEKWTQVSCKVPKFVERCCFRAHLLPDFPQENIGMN